ncbi:hypothetical protein Hanom_Chr08g00684701 [Helianthus anomalus]
MRVKIGIDKPPRVRISMVGGVLVVRVLRDSKGEDGSLNLTSLTDLTRKGWMGVDLERLNLFSRGMKPKRK